MTGPGPSDPAGQEPAPGAPAPDPAQPAAGGSWQQAPTPGAAPTIAQQAQNWKPAEVAPGPTAGIAYADLPIRIGAYIIDAVIIGIVTVLIYTILASLFFFAGGIGLLIFVVLAGGASLAISAVYFVYTWTTMKASPGQRMLGLMTVQESDGSALTQNQAITRWAILSAPWIISFVFNQVFAYNILGLLVSLAGLGWTIYLLYTTANDPKRQGFHDKYAKTVVVKPVATV